jgi:hypothetical protein
LDVKANKLETWNIFLSRVKSNVSLPQVKFVKSLMAAHVFSSDFFLLLLRSHYMMSLHLPWMMPRHWLAAVWRDFLSRKNFLVEITQKISAEKTRLGSALRLVHFTRVAIPNFFGVDACWIDLLCQVWFYKKCKIRKSPVPVFTKCQLISEWNFDVFKSPKKSTKF